MDDCLCVENREFNIYKSDALVFTEIDDVAHELKEQLENDYKGNLNEPFDFIYHISYLDEKEDCLCVDVELFYPEPTTIGSVTYSLSLKKTKSKYYLWPF